MLFFATPVRHCDFFCDLYQFNLLVFCNDLYIFFVIKILLFDRKYSFGFHLALITHLPSLEQTFSSTATHEHTHTQALIRTHPHERTSKHTLRRGKQIAYVLRNDVRTLEKESSLFRSPQQSRRRLINSFYSSVGRSVGRYKE